MEKANDLGIQLPKHVIFGEPTELKLAVSQKVKPPPTNIPLTTKTPPLTESLHLFDCYEI
jgi:hypothetical protein